MCVPLNVHATVSSLCFLFEDRTPPFNIQHLKLCNLLLYQLENIFIPEIFFILKMRSFWIVLLNGQAYILLPFHINK